MNSLNSCDVKWVAAFRDILTVLQNEQGNPVIPTENGPDGLDAKATLKLWLTLLGIDVSNVE